MNLEAAANYSDVLGGIAVIFSLIYVGFQIRKNTQVNQGIATQQTFASTQTIYSWHAEDSGVSELFTRFNQGDTLTIAESVRMSHLMYGMLDQYQVYFILNKLKMMDQESFQSFFRKLLLVVGTPPAAQWFRTNRGFYRRDFVKAVEKLLEENPNAVSKNSLLYAK